MRSGRPTEPYTSTSLAGTEDLDFSPDGKLLASAARTAGTTTIWDVERQSVRSDMSGPVAPYAVRFSPDGKLIAVGDSSGNVVFWKLDPRHQFEGVWAPRRVGPPLAGQNGGVSSIDFDPRGRTLVTLSDDGKLRLWDVALRKLIGAPLPGSNTGGSVDYFPDGKHVLGDFQSGTGIIWNVDPAAWKAQACRVAHRNLSPPEWTEFLGRRRYRKVCP